MGFKESIIHGAKVVGKKLKAKSPTILVVTGTIGLVVAGVTACRQTHKELDKVLEEHKKEVQALKDIRDGKVVLKDITTEQYAAEKYKKHLTHVYLKTICKLGKVYAVPFLLAALSVTSILTGHGILNKWHLNAVAECYAIRETLNDYRERVKGKIGPEAEKLLFLDAEKGIVTDKEIDDEGNETQESRESLIGTGVPNSYTYEISEATMRSFYHFNHPRTIETMMSHRLTDANNHMELHDIFFISDFMRHHWKDEYLMQRPEVFSDGWMRNNPLTDHQIDEVAPIQADLVRIADDVHGKPRWTITFNAQGNVVNAVSAKRNKDRAQKKLNRKIKAIVK